MPDVGGTCTYVLDPDDPATWGGKEDDECYVRTELLEDGKWFCPHDATQELDGEKRCIFHLPVDAKDDEEVVTAFLHIIDSLSNSQNPDTTKLQFLGAKFGMFDIAENSIPAESGHLSLTHSTFSDEVDWSGMSVDVPTTFSGVNFETTVEFVGTEFDGNAEFRGSGFNGNRANFVNSKFGGATDFESATFSGYSNFAGTEFHKVANFVDVDFAVDEKTNFKDVTFNGDALFSNSELGYADFEGTDFHGFTNFVDSSFVGDTTFENASFATDVTFYDTDFAGDSIFSGSEFGGDAEFGESELSGDIAFDEVVFNKGASFDNISVAEADFSNSDLTDSSFIGADATDVDFERSLLSRATLFGTDCRGAKLSGAVLGDVRIDDSTKFLGHPSANIEASPHTFSAIRSRPRCVYDPKYATSRESIPTRIQNRVKSLFSSADSRDEQFGNKETDKAKSVYRAFEELGRKHARPRLQARSFVRRQDLQKGEYKQEYNGADSIQKRLIAGARYSRAKVARATLLYGESPWRVIAYSISIILGFALLFPIGGWMKPDGGDPLTYAQIASNPLKLLNSVYYSTLTFTALGFGDFKPVGWGRALIAIETGLGAVLLALLVFILGRRAAR